MRTGRRLRRGKRRRAVLGVLTTLATLTTVASAEPLDDFSAPALGACWHVSQGTEFPGATGSIELSGSAPERALAVRYDFREGGLYVAAVCELEAPVAMRYLSVRARTSDDVRLGVRVRDASGQWLQYRPARPLTALEPKAWYRTTLELARPAQHWGGANDGVVHGSVSALALFVEAAVPRAAGLALFDDLSTTAALTLDLEPSALALGRVPRAERGLLDGFGVALHDLADERALDAAASAGFTWVRTDLFWDRFEKPRKTYDFADADRFLSALEARRLRPLLILGLGHAGYGGGPPVSPAASAGFRAFAAAAAKHFAGRGVRYEIWNEPNIARFWPPAPNAVAAANVAALGARAVHEGDPHAEVVTGGLSWFELPFLDAFLAAGAAADAEAVGIHPYRGKTAPESLTDELVAARRVVRARLGRDVPLWDTEWGYAASQFGAAASSAARQRQAVFAVRRLVASRLSGFPLAIWYDLKDDGKNEADDEHHFGLLAHDGSEKPALAALRTLNALATGRTIAGFLDAGAPVVNGVVLDGADRLVMLWSTGAERDVTVRTPVPLAATDLFGKHLPLAPRYVLSESAGPIYLTFAAVSHDGVRATPAPHPAPAPAPTGEPNRVAPTARGCGCAVPACTPALPSAWLGVLLLLARRRAPAPRYRSVSVPLRTSRRTRSTVERATSTSASA